MAVKVAEVLPAGVTKAAGTDSSASLLDSDTTVPLMGATLLSVTVHVVAAPELKLLGLHVNEDSTAAATKLTVADWDIPLRVAVRVAL